MFEGIAMLVVAQALDPMRLVIAAIAVAIILKVNRAYWVIFVAALISSFAVETMLVAQQSYRSFNDGGAFAFGIIASTAHSALAYWIVTRFISKDKKSEKRTVSAAVGTKGAGGE